MWALCFLFWKVLIIDSISLIAIRPIQTVNFFLCKFDKLCLSKNWFMSSMFIKFVDTKKFLWTYSCSEYLFIILLTSIKSVVLIPLLFLILVICVIFFFVGLVGDLLILLIFSKNKLLVLLTFYLISCFQFCSFLL